MDTIPMVPRFVVEPALEALARRLPPEGAIIVTDRPERLGPISSNLLRVLGLAATAGSVIMIAPTTEAERAEVERLKATGQLRPIFHDPAMPAYRQPKPVPPPESVEDLIAAQARDMRRRLKLKKRAARHARRAGHHAALLRLIDGLHARSCVILVQNAAYGRHVVNQIRRSRPDLVTGRLAIFVHTCVPGRAESEAIGELPDFASSLPVLRAPGRELACLRNVAREQKAAAALAAKTEAERAEEAAKAEAERIAEVKRGEAAAVQAAHDRAVEEAERQARDRLRTRFGEWPRYPSAFVEVEAGPAVRTVEDRLAICEHALAELMAWFARSFGAPDALPDVSISERGEWLAGLRQNLRESRHGAVHISGEFSGDSILS